MNELGSMAVFAVGTGSQSFKNDDWEQKKN